ncbi:MAG: hypothetical protein U0797_18490, partial [Gemmataceae bacterium]
MTFSLYVPLLTVMTAPVADTSTPSWIWPEGASSTVTVKPLPVIVAAVRLALRVIVGEVTVRVPATVTAALTVTLPKAVVTNVRLVLAWPAVGLVATVIVLAPVPSVALVSRTTVVLPNRWAVSVSVPPSPVLPLTTRAGTSPVALSKPPLTTSALAALAGDATVAVSMPVMSTGSRLTKLMFLPATATTPFPLVVADGVYRAACVPL